MKRPHDTPTNSLDRVRQLRKAATEPEKRLWGKLRSRQLKGLKFRRQVWIGNFIVDFISPEAKLVIEVDGDSHADNRSYDEQRSRFIASEGFQVIRFTNAEVMTNMAGVLEAIANATVGSVPSPSHSQANGPLPLPHGERQA